MRGFAGVRVAIATALVVLAAPAVAWGHAERPAHFPDYPGQVPTLDEGDPDRVVCASDSADRIAAMEDGTQKEAAESLLGDQGCAVEGKGFRTIQAAVNAAGNEERIAILPGVYKEQPSRDTASEGTAECRSGMKSEAASIPGTGIDLGTSPEQVPNYEFQRKCPNAQNLIAIVGDKTAPEDSPDDRKCDDKCGLQIEGFGDSPDDVLIQGDKKKLNVIRADRADGIYLKNFTIEFSDFNNIYALETNGFRFDDIESRYSREYGFLSFTSDNGLYENLDAHHAGDSGVYPGSGPEYHCNGYGIEIKGVDSHDNTIGYSGTAGNGIYAHGNRFYNNATGMTTDSFASGHPGMPQDCAKWENNRIYSNNNNLFSDERDRYCQQTPYEDRDEDKVCPTFQVPVGTGLLIGGGNNNIVKDNWIYDNWRNGTSLFYVPPTARGETGEGNPWDTSYGNRQEGNRMGLRPNENTPDPDDGTSDPNGIDFWWDEENGYERFDPDPRLAEPGVLNCWTGNSAAAGAKLTSDPVILPRCDGTRAFRPGNPAKIASQATCATWDPETNTDPPGCDWFRLPSEPKPKKSANR